MLRGHAILLKEISWEEGKDRQAAANAFLAEGRHESCVGVAHLLCIRGSSPRE